MFFVKNLLFQYLLFFQFQSCLLDSTAVIFRQSDGHVCKIGSEFFPEDRMNINYETDNFNTVFKEIKNIMDHLTKLNHIQIIEHIKVVIDCVFDTRYQREHIGPTPIQPTFKFSAVVADVISHALVLT